MIIFITETSPGLVVVRCLPVTMQQFSEYHQRGEPVRSWCSALWSSDGEDVMWCWTCLPEWPSAVLFILYGLKPTAAVLTLVVGLPDVGLLLALSRLSMVRCSTWGFWIHVQLPQASHFKCLSVSLSAGVLPCIPFPCLKRVLWYLNASFGLEVPHKTCRAFLSQFLENLSMTEDINICLFS